MAESNDEFICRNLIEHFEESSPGAEFYQILIKLFEESSPGAEFYQNLKKEYCSNCAESKGWTVSLDNMTTEELLFLAKQAESTKQYRDVLHCMHFVLKNSGGDITAEEEKLLTDAYTKVIRPLKAVQDKLAKMMIKEASKEQLIEEYMAKVEEEMLSVRSKMRDILRCIIRIPVNDSTEFTEVGKDYPRFKDQGTLIGWFFLSRIYKKPSVIKSLISSKMLFRTPLKIFSNFLIDRNEDLQKRARAELLDAFKDNFSLFGSALSQLKVLYPKLLRTQRKIKLRKRSLIWRRPHKHITIWGRTCYKTGKEKRCEKLLLLVDQIVDWTEQLMLYGVEGIISNCSRITVERQSDITLAGPYRGSGHFTGVLRINAKFKPEIIYSMIAEGLEWGFPLEKMKLYGADSR